MSEPQFSPEARQDLQSILDDISCDNPAAANALIDRLEKKCEALAQFPHSGSARSELKKGLRSFSVGNYLIYYATIAEGIRVERVLHGAQDVDSAFEG